MRENRVLKATVWYALGNFFIKGINFISTPIFARILTKAEYGIYSNIMTWYAIISVVSTLSLSSTLVVARFDHEHELKSYVKTCLILGTVVTAIISGVLLAFVGFFSNLMAISSRYIIFICITVLVAPAYDMFLLLQRFQYKYLNVVFSSFVIAVSNILMSLILIYLIDDNLMARTIGTFMPTFIVSLALYVYYLLIGGKLKFAFCEYALVLALPYIVHLLSGTILESADRTIITKIKGPEATATYSIAYSLGMIINVLWGAMNSAFSPWLGEKLNSGEYQIIKKYSYGYILVFSGLVIAISLGAPELMLIIGGKKYYEAKYCVPPIIGGYFFWFVYSMYVNVEQYKKKIVPMAIATSMAGMINVITNVFFVTEYGYLAAAYTTWFCYFLLFIFHYLVVRKMRLHFIYDFKFVVMVSIAVGITMLLNACLLYDNAMARYIIALLWTILVISYIRAHKNECIRYFKTTEE